VTGAGAHAGRSLIPLYEAAAVLTLGDGGIALLLLPV
jgi:hypothetical protein